MRVARRTLRTTSNKKRRSSPPARASTRKVNNDMNLPRLASLEELEDFMRSQKFLAAGPTPNWDNPLTPPAQTPTVGCRLQDFSGRWEVLFGEIQQTKWVRSGVPLDFVTEPPPLQRSPTEFPLSSPHLESLRITAVQGLLKKGAIEIVTNQSSPGLYNRLFLRPKPDGTWRPIIDLRSELLYRSKTN